MNEHPELSDGHARIANEIMEALARTHMSSYESKFLWCLFRKTYGWGKKDDFISLTQIAASTGMHLSHVSRTKKMLMERHIVTKGGNKIAFNKYYSQWRELPKGVRSHHELTKRGKKVAPPAPFGNDPPPPLVITPPPKGAGTKETLTKETIQKKYSPSENGVAAEIVKKKLPRDSVEVVMKEMKLAFAPLDDTEKMNRRYAWLLIQRAQKLSPGTDEKQAAEMCVKLIRLAKESDFWGAKITKVETLYRNANRIVRDVKTPNVHFIS